MKTPRVPISSTGRRWSRSPWVAISTSSTGCPIRRSCSATHSACQAQAGCREFPIESSIVASLESSFRELLCGQCSMNCSRNYHDRNAGGTGFPQSASRFTARGASRENIVHQEHVRWFKWYPPRTEKARRTFSQRCGGVTLDCGCVCLRRRNRRSANGKPNLRDKTSLKMAAELVRCANRLRQCNGIGVTTSTPAAVNRSPHCCHTKDPTASDRPSPLASFIRSTSSRSRSEYKPAAMVSSNHNLCPRQRAAVGP